MVPVCSMSPRGYRRRCRGRRSICVGLSLDGRTNTPTPCCTVLLCCAPGSVCRKADAAVAKHALQAFHFLQTTYDAPRVGCRVKWNGISFMLETTRLCFMHGSLPFVKVRGGASAPAKARRRPLWPTRTRTAEWRGQRPSSRRRPCLWG